MAPATSTSSAASTPATTAAPAAESAVPGPDRPSLLAAVPLTDLARGQSGELLGCKLQGVDRQLLFALGLCESSRLRLCKAGDPWIVQVRGTRIGLSDAVARRLFVIPDP